MLSTHTASFHHRCVNGRRKTCICLFSAYASRCSPVSPMLPAAVRVQCCQLHAAYNQFVPGTSACPRHTQRCECRLPLESTIRQQLSCTLGCFTWPATALPCGTSGWKQRQSMGAPNPSLALSHCKLGPQFCTSLEIATVPCCLDLCRGIQPFTTTGFSLF